MEPPVLPKDIRIVDTVLEKVTAQCPEYLSPTAFINQLVDNALDNMLTLGLPSAAKEVPLTSTSSSSSTKRSITSSPIKSVPPSLTAHEDLITAFWKTKAGSKSDAGWKLLMTELQKIQDKYGDRVIREQLELAAASRWKGVSLRNYEQFGLQQKKRETGSTFDWDTIDGISI